MVLVGVTPASRSLEWLSFSLSLSFSFSFSLSLSSPPKAEKEEEWGRDPGGRGGGVVEEKE